MPVLKFPEPGATDAPHDAELGKITDFLGRRLSERKAFVAALKEAGFRNQLLEDQSEWLFASVVDLAINDYGVRQKHLAALIRANTASIGRWAAKTAAPTPIARVGVVDAIIQLLEFDISAAESPAEAR